MWGFLLNENLKIVGKEDIMENYLEEENGYFKSVVKDAIDDLKHNKQAYVFYEEQVNAVKELFDKEIIVEEKEGVFYLTLDRKCVNI